MAILLSTASGSSKTAETNKATLERLARGQGDKISFDRVLGHGVRYEAVKLGGRPVGLLFDSHEDTIKYLTARSSRPRPRAMAVANPGKGHAKPRRRKAMTKPNDGVVKQKFTKKQMADQKHTLSKDKKFATLTDGRVFIWDDRFQHWASWK